MPFVCLVLVPPLMTDAGTAAAEVPLAEIFINIGLVVVPLLLGLGLGAGCAHRRAPRFVSRVERHTGFVGTFVILTLVILRWPPPPLEPLSWACIIGLGAGSLLWGGGLGVALGQPRAIVSSMALETAVHDAPLALATISFAFPGLPAEIIEGALGVVVCCSVVVALVAAALALAVAAGRARAPRDADAACARAPGGELMHMLTRPLGAARTPDEERI